MDHYANLIKGVAKMTKIMEEAQPVERACGPGPGMINNALSRDGPELEQVAIQQGP